MKIYLPDKVKFIIDTLNRNGHEAFAVGGCVRDSLLHKEPKDWDITTNALPSDMMDIFEHTIPTGLKHGTITVVLDKENFEITTYRIEAGYSDNRHPDKVEFTRHLCEDLSRRDFTVNAMAYNNTEGLQDLFNGMEDLSKGIIKCVGNPDERFQEDALRMLRAVRFSCVLGFEIHIATLCSIQQNASLIKNISAERINTELSKILLSPTPSRGMKTLASSGLLEFILPELQLCIGFNQHNPHHNKDVFLHTMSVLDVVSPTLALRLAALFHDIAKPTCFSLDDKGVGHFYNHAEEGAKLCDEILRRLKFDNNTISTVCLFVKEHMNCYNLTKESSIKKLINRVGTDNIFDFLKLLMADSGKSKAESCPAEIILLKENIEKILQDNPPLSLKQLAINGNDLMSLGFPKSKAIGQCLQLLLDNVLENPENNSYEILSALAINYKNNL